MPMKAPAPRRRSDAIRGMLTIASTTAGATLVVAATASGTYALWADTASMNAGVIQSGSLTLLVNDQPSVVLSQASWGTMFPGDRTKHAVTLKNTGTVAADIAAAVSLTGTGASDYSVDIAPGPCPAASTDLSTIPLTALPAGGSTPVCIEVTLKDGASAASQSVAISVGIVFTATQKTA